MLYDERSGALIKPVLPEQPLEESMLDAMARLRGTRHEGQPIREVVLAFFDANMAETWLPLARKHGLSVRVTAPGKPVTHLYRCQPTLSDEA